WLRAAHHCHQQAHRKSRSYAGNCNPWGLGRRERILGRSARSRTADAWTIERRRACRLRGDQGEDPRRFEAIYLQTDTKATAHHAGDLGDLRTEPPPMITLADIERAQSCVSGVAARTP